MNHFYEYICLINNVASMKKLKRKHVEKSIIS